MAALSTDLLIRESGAWLAASLLAGKYFTAPGMKFVTTFKHNGDWLAIQWVTTSSGIFGSAAQVCPGRVGIARRRRKAINSMGAQHWSANVPEPPGLTVGVQIYPRLGKGA